MALPSNFQSVKYKEEIKEFFQSKLLKFFLQGFTVTHHGRHRHNSCTARAQEDIDPVAHFPAFPLLFADPTHSPHTRRVTSGKLAFPVFRAQRLHGVFPQPAHREHISAPDRKRV